MALFASTQVKPDVRASLRACFSNSCARPSMLRFDMLALQSIQVNYLTGLANFEVDGSLAKLLSHAREQFTCFAYALRWDKDLQPITCLFINSTVIRHPSTHERTLQGVAAKRVTDK